MQQICSVGGKTTCLHADKSVRARAVALRSARHNQLNSQNEGFLFIQA
jgi:hypothetical protein